MKTKLTFPNSAKWTAISLVAAMIGLTATALAQAQPKKAPKASTVGPHLVKLPPSTGDDDDVMDALHKAGGAIGSYTIDKSRTQVQLQDISVIVVNRMDVFTEPIESNAPGHYGFGGRPKTLTQAERDKVTETVRQFVAGRLGSTFRVTPDAQLAVVLILAGKDIVYMEGGLVPMGVIDVALLLVDKRSKSVIWHSDRAWGEGKTVDRATGSVTARTVFAAGFLLGK